MSGNVDLGIGALETLRTVPFWRTDEVPRHVARRMLVIPGVRYSCDRPLLNWTSTIAHQHGWWVQQAQWELTPQTNQEEIIARALELLDHDAPDADQTMVVAKSMGSRAASTASANGWCGIWLTPLLDVEEVRAALLEYHGPSLIAGGSIDPHWGPDDSVRTVHIGRAGDIEGELDELGTSWVDVAGANHSLEVPDDWRASLAVQRSLFELADGFIDVLSQ
ncbi:hypothetical protein [Propionibacterium freudenreichii]|uniref:Alpha/beta hydrolase n=1 Tax=Propionibacterium freudenreichii subsp. freudenreichii TaxID=66712 RepID=A0A0B7NZZ2_PROFF|nr:hypothetical protein [Propionibacterium freudenreichii]AJQ90484.1 Hypothetical protein RM25_0759 [Propionibacterium freudenreichii subsp. freudenreichii]MCT2973111.1 hypothetical protein [Propionibacterium freudenreichii]MDK9341411.1 hypothetical protein [Propionibacterium freudenreichii]CEG91604.1 Hypothetical protein PFCIRM121_11635 [Propionibacterium freudenreichii]CEP27084.1 Hypothetical protein PFCIRM138_11810 [Propionibacterium freudenreichii subsp. freudenreichii]